MVHLFKRLAKHQSLQQTLNRRIPAILRHLIAKAKPQERRWTN